MTTAFETLIDQRAVLEGDLSVDAAARAALAEITERLNDTELRRRLLRRMVDIEQDTDRQASRAQLLKIIAHTSILAERDPATWTVANERWRNQAGELSPAESTTILAIREGREVAA